MVLTIGARGRVTRVGTIGVALSAGVLLYVADPVTSGVYPACVFRALTGLECPGCGSARTLHALAHLDLPQAIGFNVLVVIALPWLAYRYLRWLSGSPSRAHPASPAVLTLLAAGVMAFAVARNLPWAPASWLAAG